jgi:hypothetical protein
MAGPWFIKCSMAVGAVLALAACGGDYGGDPRSASDLEWEAEMESQEQATNEAGQEALEDFMNDQDAMAATWYASHPQE